MATIDIVKKNFNEFIQLAQIAFETKRYNAAVTLYYKALVELCDLELLKKTNKIGANHQDRFLLLKINNSHLYEIASKLFRYYRDSYSKEISETIARVVKENVEKAKTIIFFEKKD
jgi:S-methylmethionine-dependent homocysteine/selenocysteine methylase